MDIKTVVRFAEAFLVVFFTTFASTVTIGGQAIDLTSDAGRAAAVSAVVSAALLAARRAFATSTSTTGS